MMIFISGLFHEFGINDDLKIVCGERCTIGVA